MEPIEDAIKILHQQANQLYRQHKSDEEIIEFVIAKGYDRHYAETVLDNIREDAADRNNFWKTILYGTGFLVAGLLLSFSSYYFARSMGLLFYFFYWGLVVAGISFIARAFILFRK